MRFLLTIAILSMSMTAHAGRGIPSPYVNEGQTDIATDGLIVTSGSKDIRQRFTYDYGLTDKIGLRLRSTHDDFSDHHFKFTRAEFAIKYQISEKDELAVDLGLYFDYFKNYGSDISDNGQIRFLIAKDLEEWIHVGNVIVNKRFDESLGSTDLGIRFKSHYKLDDANKVGYEYFGNYGDFNEGFSDINKESHSFGPNWQHKLDGTGLKTELGVLFGLTRPSDPVTLKWKLSYSF